MTPLKKQKTIMKTKNMIWAALSMTAALVMTACTNDDNIVETPAAPQAEVKTIPYSVTVGQGGDAATTRATVDDDMKTLRFAAGDQLYIQSDDLKGILKLKKGDEGKTDDATFEGTISYTGEAPEDGKTLMATLVRTNNVNFDIVDDKVYGCYTPAAYYDDVKKAVEEFSYLTGASTYGEKKFTLEQIEAFLNFEITFEDGTAAGTTLTTVVSNGGDPTPLCSADVTTKSEGGKVVAKFVLPVNAGCTLSGATVKMGGKAAHTINDATLKGKVYNVKRTQAPAVPLSLTSPAVGQVIGSDGKNYDVGSVPVGVTAVAMIAYLGNASDCTNGLAIQLKDSPEYYNWADAKKYAAGLTEFTGGTWRLPSKADWQNMFVGCAVSGDASASNVMEPIAGFKAKIAATGITWLSYSYWSSTGSGSNALSVEVVLDGDNAFAQFADDDPLGEWGVLGCLAF